MIFGARRGSEADQAAQISSVDEAHASKDNRAVAWIEVDQLMHWVGRCGHPRGVDFVAVGPDPAQPSPTLPLAAPPAWVIQDSGTLQATCRTAASRVMSRPSRSA